MRVKLLSRDLKPALTPPFQLPSIINMFIILRNNILNEFIVYLL